MANIKPYHQDKDKDPWSGKNQSSPPDLDELLTKFSRRIKGAVGGKGSGGNSQQSDSGGLGILGFSLFIVLLFLWALSGIYIVGPAEEAVVLRFGKYLKTEGPGPHWSPRFIDTRYIEDVKKLRDFSYSAQMLTKNETIVSAAVVVKYRVGNLNNYLFNIADPEESIRQATASALRQVVGHTTLDAMMTEGREAWGGHVESLLKNILEGYKAGITIISVAPQQARVPDRVQDAFDDAINAREDEKRYTEKALAYKAKVVPLAQGGARRLLEQAEAYSKAVVLNAKGTVAEFLALLPQYKKSSQVTAMRLYMDAIETVLKNTAKVVVSGKGSPLVYLPVDKMMAAHPGKAGETTDVSVISLDGTNKVGSSSQSNAASNMQASRSSRMTRSDYTRQRSYP